MTSRWIDKKTGKVVAVIFIDGDKVWFLNPGNPERKCTSKADFISRHTPQEGIAEITSESP